MTVPFGGNRSHGRSAESLLGDVVAAGCHRAENLFLKHRRMSLGLIFFVITSCYLHATMMVMDYRIDTNSKVDHASRRRPSIGIFIAADTHSQEMYDPNLQSIRCYAKRHDYDLILVDDLDQTTIRTFQNRVLHFTPQQQHFCASILAFFFQRQCVATQVLPFYDFLVMFDADDAVVNANITIESILLRASRKPTTDHVFVDRLSMQEYIPHVIHEQRFHTGEIMAGNMILQNTSFAQDYMRQWIGYHFNLPEPEHDSHSNKLVNKFYHNKIDNPSLSMVFLRNLARIVETRSSSDQESTLVATVNTTLTPSHQSLIDNCERLWKLSVGNQKYLHFIQCVEQTTSQLVQDIPTNNPANAIFPLYLFRRGHGGLGRDIQTCHGNVSPLDLIIHNLKPQSKVIKNVAGFYSQRPTCDDHTSVTAWQAPVAQDRWKSLDQMKQLMQSPSCLAKATKIAGCWPDCTIG
jgi:hypothetical protein